MPNFPTKTILFVAFLYLLIRGVLEFSGGSEIFGKFLRSSYRIVFTYCVPWLYRCCGYEVPLYGRDFSTEYKPIFNVSGLEINSTQ